VTDKRACALLAEAYAAARLRCVADGTGRVTVKALEGSRRSFDATRATRMCSAGDRLRVGD
jgi:hypothetical protein